MSTYRVPDALVTMLADGRVIPFAGAGVSRNLGLPGWHELLQGIHAELVAAGVGVPPGTVAPDYESVSRGRQADPLQLAEYLFLRAGAEFGPILYRLSRRLQPQLHIAESSPHIELANLDARLIYTTNYDDLIERTYRELGRPVMPVALARDLAVPDMPGVTRVVKYHGDLQYESTIVFTQRQYYARLDLDSPLDLKLRADLFGRSVLFLGYSFQDINVRLIWFKLMQAMHGVPEKRRPRSYIVLPRPDPLLEELYAADGIETIVLCPVAQADDAMVSEALSRFMLDLALACEARGWHDPATPRFVSLALLDAIDEAFTADSQTADEIMSGRVAELLAALSERDVPPAATGPQRLGDRLSEVLLTIARGARRAGASAILMPMMVRLAQRHLGDRAIPGLTFFFLHGLMDRDARAALHAHAGGLNWGAIWRGRLNTEQALELVMQFTIDIDRGERSDDLLYGARVVKAIADSPALELVGPPDALAARQRAAAEWSRAVSLHDGLSVTAQAGDQMPWLSWPSGQRTAAGPAAPVP